MGAGFWSVGGGGMLELVVCRLFVLGWFCFWVWVLGVLGILCFLGGDMLGWWGVWARIWDCGSRFIGCLGCLG